MSKVLQQLETQCEAWGLRLNGDQLVLLDLYADLLSNYSLANVIGTKDKRQIILDHLLDSLGCMTSESMRRTASIVDVGTGGGLPGVPLGIVLPQASITLLEATAKKVRFLEYVKERLDLSNLHVLHARVEDVGRDPFYRESFDLATTRAVAALAVVIEYCAPLILPTGKILSMKGNLPAEEFSAAIAAAQFLNVRLGQVREVEFLPQFPEKRRQLVEFEKIGVISQEFPRRVGLARKRPLGE